MLIHKNLSSLLWVVTMLLLLSSCSHDTKLQVSAGIGPTPILPPPHVSLIPTVNIAPAKGWSAGATPHAAIGLSVAAFMRNLDHPR